MNVKVYNFLLWSVVTVFGLLWIAFLVFFFESLGSHIRLIADEETVMPRHTYIVSVELIEGDVSKQRMAEHIRDAVRDWSEQFHPKDELFSFNIRKVTVKPVKENSK